MGDGKWDRYRTGEDFGEVDDGFGMIAPRCRPACGIQVVRPGETQCWCDDMSVDEYILYLEELLNEKSER